MDLDKLLVKIEADTSDLRRELERARRETRTATSRMSRSFEGLRGKLSGLARGVLSLKGALVGLGAGLIIRNIVNTAAAFEQLRVQLKTVTGSAEAAESAFQQVLDMASKTPFTVQDIVKSFVQLRAMGIDPTTERLLAFGDLAAAFGRNITDAAAAVTGAITGETERLKAFGVTARIEGDKVTFIFNNQRKTVKRTADAVTDFLTEMSQARFGGAMADQSNTLTGAFSNVEDAMDALKDKAGRSGGLNDALTSLARKITSIANANDGLAISLGRFLAKLTGWSEGLLDFFDELSRRLPKSGLEGQLEKVNSQLDAYRKKLEKIIRLDLGGHVFEIGNADIFRQRIKELEKQRVELLNLMERAAVNRPPLPTPTEVPAVTSVPAINPDFEQDLARMREASKGYKDYVFRLNDAQKHYDAWLSTFEEGEEIFDATRTAQERFNRTQDNLNRLLNSGAITQETFNRAIDQAEKELEDEEQAASKVSSVMREMGASFSSAFEDAIVAGKGLRGVLQGLYQDLIRIASRKMITDPLFGALFGTGESEGWLSKIFSTDSAKGNAFSGPIVPFAKGGALIPGPIAFPMAGRMGVAGEKGEEAIFPIVRTHSGDLGVRAVGGGGGNMNISIVNNTPTRASARQQPNGDLLIVLDQANETLINRAGSRTNRAMRTGFGLTPQTVTR